MDINCEYKLETWGGERSELYTCKVTSAYITSPNTTIRSFIGTHFPGKGNYDVQAVFFDQTVVEYLPLGVHKIFPRLIGFSVFKCGLKTIAQDDLSGLENLTTFYVQENKLKFLPADLFANMQSLRGVSFWKNQLELSSSEVLHPIMNNGLNVVHFGGNSNIDAFYAPGTSGSFATLKDLMAFIDKKCSKPTESACFKDKMLLGFKEMWSTGRLSDFTIIVGTKQFNVHKNVLSIHSAVFATMFLSKKNETPPNDMNIQDLSVGAVEHFLRYLYTGELPDSTHAMDAFALAARMDVPEVKLACEGLLLKVLDQSNAYQMFILGNNYSSDKIKRSAFSEIKLMFPEASLPDDLMQQPERLKELIDGKRSYEAMIQKFKKT